EERTIGWPRPHREIRHLAPPSPQIPEQDQAIAAVVTTPHRGYDSPAWKEPVDDLRSRPPRVLHEHPVRDTTPLPGMTVQRRGLTGRQDRDAVAAEDVALAQLSTPPRRRGDAGYL